MAHPFDRLLTIDTLRVDDALRAFDALVRAHTLMQPPGSYLRRTDGVLRNSEGKEHDPETDSSKSTLAGWIIRGIGKGWTAYHPAFVIVADVAGLDVRLGADPAGVVLRKQPDWSRDGALAVLRKAIVKAGTLADVVPFGVLEAAER